MLEVSNLFAIYHALLAKGLRIRVICLLECEWYCLAR